MSRSAALDLRGTLDGRGMERPDWWDWPLAFTAHLESRVEERDFTEVDLRRMLEDSTGLVPSKRPGRWLVRTRHAGESWVVVVEPDVEQGFLMVVTAYPSTPRS